MLIRGSRNDRVVTAGTKRNDYLNRVMTVMDLEKLR